MQIKNMKKKLKETKMLFIIIISVIILASFIYIQFFKSYRKEMQASIKRSLVQNLEYILSDGLNSTDQNGWTPLHKSTFIGETEITKQLLEKGANTEIKNIIGETPLLMSMTSKVV